MGLLLDAFILQPLYLFNKSHRTMQKIPFKAYLTLYGEVILILFNAIRCRKIFWSYDWWFNFLILWSKSYV